MLSFEFLEQRLATYPRLRYSAYPTPLEPLENLSRRLGGPSLWIKRDDGIGHAMGGNKGRKLEFLMADARQKGKRKVVTFGGLQSNHTRMTAAACAALGKEAHLFFFERRPGEFQGNLLLNQLLGAKMHFIAFGGGGEAGMSIDTANRLVRLLSAVVAGPSSYFIPNGGHNLTGCLGYVVAALEIHRQLAQLDRPAGPVTLVTACGSGGTLAGLMAGLALIDSPIRLLGLDIGKIWRGFPGSIARLATKLCQAMGEDISFSPADVPMIEGTYAGEGYAQPSPVADAAMTTMAQTQGILLDPIYTAKAFAGLLDLVEQGRFAAGETVIFLHTGGAPSLWA
jgi:L-cysteate sulfo-lyase